MVFLSNIFAIFLQSLCVKLGSVTGMNLAENCRAHLPKWLNYVLYFLAECAIIATDIAEVSLQSLVSVRKAVLSNIICTGHWYSYRTIFALKDTTCRWLCHLDSGCAFHIVLLQS